MAVLLVVEDEPMIAGILRHKLSREGHEVRIAADIPAAERELAGGPVDLALVDATLDADGLAWAGALEATRLPRHGWVAVVEARAAGAPERAFALGAAAVVVKPFKPTAVAAEVARLLGAGEG